MQGGRYKAMFKLRDSRPHAEKLAAKEPDRFQVGSGEWITARFTSEKPMPGAIWEKWLDESYAISVGSVKKAVKKKTAGSTSKGAGKKKAVRKGAKGT
jgi:hypothetical protein